MKYHSIAFFLGFLLDLSLGDPYWLPHPVRLMGAFIQKTDVFLRKRGKGEKKRELFLGGILVVLVLAATALTAGLILFFAYRLHPYAGLVVEMLMTYQLLATKCLRVESMKVYDCLKYKTLLEARWAVSFIVGRDTEALDEKQVTRAAIETVAENTSDGVIAPMVYTAVGGPVLGFLYKAVNTMDSMLGYKNTTYLYFGRAAAKLDDFVNFLPARLSALFMIAAAFLGEKFSNDKKLSGKGAVAIYKRDRKKHASPNAAQTEAVCAGALGILLCGDACYFGKKVKKPYIGEPLREVEYEDIKRANRLLYLTAVLGELFCLLGMGVVYRVLA